MKFGHFLYLIILPGFKSELSSQCKLVTHALAFQID